MKDINKKVSETLDDIVFEVLNRDWKKSLEALHDLARMVKSAGMTSKEFNLIMENLETEMRVRAGPEIINEWRKVLQHKEHYMKGSVIIIP